MVPIELLGQYIDQLVLPELQEAQINNLGMLKATCIKFIYMFRNQIPDQYIPPLLEKIADFLKS